MTSQNKLTLREASDILHKLPADEWERGSGENRWTRYSTGVQARMRLVDTALWTKKIIGYIEISVNDKQIYEHQGAELIPVIESVLRQREAFYENQAREELENYLPAQRVKEVLENSMGERK